MCLQAPAHRRNVEVRPSWPLCAPPSHWDVALFPYMSRAALRRVWRRGRSPQEDTQSPGWPARRHRAALLVTVASCWPETRLMAARQQPRRRRRWR
jgi:hypothetical protein